MNDIKKQLQQVTDLLDKVQKRIDHPNKLIKRCEAVDENHDDVFADDKTAKSWNVCGAFNLESKGFDRDVIAIAKNYLATAMLSIDTYENIAHTDSDDTVLFRWSYEHSRMHSDVMKAFEIARDLINQDMARYCS